MSWPPYSLVLRALFEHAPDPAPTASRSRQDPQNGRKSAAGTEIFKSLISHS
jgi:hypothetical protein